MGKGNNSDGTQQTLIKSGLLFWFILGLLILVLAFLPVISVFDEVVVERVVTTFEPYTVQEEIQEPYQTYTTVSVQEPYTEWQIATDPRTGSFKWPLYSEQVTKIRTVEKNIPVTKYKTVTRDVTKYREVEGVRPVVETQMRIVSVFWYLLRLMGKAYQHASCGFTLHPLSRFFLTIGKIPRVSLAFFKCLLESSTMPSLPTGCFPCYSPVYQEKACYLDLLYCISALTQ